jgi:hypothetical protein
LTVATVKINYHFVVTFSGEGASVADEFDIFENFPGGLSHWRGFAESLEDAIAKMQDFARLSNNEFMSVDAKSKEVVVRVNAARARSASA